ncbi:tetratricopeptide repeat protein [Winogradskyella flava]|uniref:tetratricopeptide repeat protein n=1 Tax=Winogradskyella flava TaxID=1884876 RepID=UPI002491B84C|nr:hypothetical protein [Winogradskyella flava]
MSLNSLQLKLCFSILYIVFSFFYSNSQSTNKLDSLKTLIQKTKIDTIKADHHLDIAQLLMYKNSKKVKWHIDKADSLYKISPNTVGIGNLYALNANYLYTQGSYDSSMVYIGRSSKQYLKAGDSLRAAKTNSNLAILVRVTTGDYQRLESIVNETEPIAIRYKDTSLMASFLGHRAAIAKNKGHRNIAIDLNRKEIALREALKDSTRMAQGFYAIGQLHLDLFDYKNAITSFDQGIIIEDNIGNKMLKAQLLEIKGLSQIKLKHYDAAEKNLKEAIKIAKEINQQNIVTTALTQLGYLEIERNNLIKADAYLAEAKSFMKAKNSFNVDYDYNLFKGQLNLAQNKYQAALKNFNVCEELAESNNSLTNLSFSKYYKSKALENLGNYKTALAVYKESSDAKDTLTTQFRTAQTVEQKIIYQTERKEKEIALQKKDIDILEQKAKVSNLQKLLLGLALLLALIAVYAFFQRSKRHRLEKEKAKIDLEYKTKELTTHALHLAKKNEVLSDLKNKAKAFKADADADPGYQMLIQTINFDLQDDNNWENFSRYFEEVHKDFNTKAQLQFPNITSNDLRLMSLLKMNLSSKEIANILNISSDGIKKARQRLRKKMGIDSSQSLEAIVIAI